MVIIVINTQAFSQNIIKGGSPDSKSHPTITLEFCSTECTPILLRGMLINILTINNEYLIQ